MLTGGLSRPDCLYTQMGFSQVHALSPSGRCAPFDARADGLVVGEGSGILSLKRLDDALRDGDHIYATIPAGGIGLSNDIAGNLMQPDSAGQLRALHAAYRQAGWSPDDIDLIECHGTGTPVGDAVEFSSLTQLWKGLPAGRKKCVLSSVKSNVGHLLTAAGSAGLIKTLLALRDRKLTPTANFTAPGVPLEQSPFTVLREPADWPRPKDHPRRAAISAFGFGGINAHVLIEEWETPTSSVSIPHSMVAPPPPPPPPKIAIVGMAARFGPWQSTAAIKRRFFGQDAAAPAAPRRWWGSPESGKFKGFFIDEVRVPLGRFRIPPAELSEMLPQQLLMLQVAADAFDDVGGVGGCVSPMSAESPAERLDTGVFIGIALDLNTTNFRFRWTMPEKARRWARDLGVAPEQLDVWIARLRAAAGPALNANRTMGALGGIVASRVARAFRIGGPSFTISSEETSPLHALEVARRALERGEINVALVGGVDLAGDLRAVLGEYVVQSKDAPDGAGAPAGSSCIGEGAAALILKRHEDALRDGDRIYALIDDTVSSADDRAVAFDTPELGRAGAASALASVVKAALALHHETLPGVHASACPRDDTSTPPESTLKRELHAIPSPAPRHWFHDRSDGPRRATVSATSIANVSAHVVLQAAPDQIPTPAIPLPEHLFVLAAGTNADLLALLAQLEELAAKNTHSLAQAAHEWFKSHPLVSAPLTLAFVAESLPYLRDLLTQARAAIAQNTPLQTDTLFFNPASLAAGNPAGKIAFVYPGSGTHFPGMGQDLAAHFPQILHRQDAENQYLASQFGIANSPDPSPITNYQLPITAPSQSTTENQ